jgi:pyruvate formate lyase activating enzyme
VTGGDTDSAKEAPVAPTGVIVDIQHFSTDDGPGIRTTVFLKGCSLRCQWCANPEGVRPRPELGFRTAQCIGVEACGHCLPACPQSAFGRGDADGKATLNWNKCDDCGLCVAVCPSRALYLYGRTMSVAQVIAEVEQDGAFYGESGGGMTLSGGECLLQPDFSAALLSEARRRGISTAIETAGNVPWRFMAQVLPHADIVLHDYKLTDPELHRRWTGADNLRILENFRRAYVTFPDKTFIARIPIIVGVNDNEAHVGAVLERIRPYTNVVDLQLLPGHRFGLSKYAYLGRDDAMTDLSVPSEEIMARLRSVIAAGFEARRQNPCAVIA